MPGANLSRYLNPYKSYYTNYFRSLYDTNKYSDFKFIYFAEPPRFVKSFYEYYKLHYLKITSLELLYEFPDQVLGSLDIFTRITRYQIADYFRQVKEDVFYNGHVETYFHATGVWMQYDIQAIQPVKLGKAEDDAYSTGVYKVCPECYKDGFFYRALLKDQPGRKLDYIECRTAEIRQSHILTRSLDTLLKHLMFGNFAYNESEAINMFNLHYLFCNHCNRSLIGEIKFFEKDEELFNECLACYTDVLWDNTLDINDEGYNDELDHCFIYNYNPNMELNREEKGFKYNAVYERYIAKRDKDIHDYIYNHTDSSEGEWIDCRHQVRSLKDLALAATVSGLDE